MLTQTAIQRRPYETFSHPVANDARTAPPARRPAADVQSLPVCFARNAEIFAEGEPAGSVYKVVSGTVRVYKVMADGRRQISAFCLPGDVFGLEAGELHRFSAEAVVASKVATLKLGRLFAGGARGDCPSRELWQVAVGTLVRTQEHLLLLGRKNALERVAAFVIEMASRTRHGDAIDLPMPRHDIADYLGLTLETVSRMFAELKDLGVVRLASARHVEVLDPGSLRRIAA
jgi:CRP/FNR family nitrogen fixation transcriptional regulator